MTVRVYNDASWLCPWPPVVLQRLMSFLLEKGGAAHMPLEVHVLRDAAMAQANLIQMGCHGPTNVLSFPPLDADAGELVPHGLKPLLPCDQPEPMPGIIILSVDTLDRECLLYGQERQEHAVRLLSHGLAHVLGYDHGEAMDVLCAELEEAGQNFFTSSAAL